MPEEAPAAFSAIDKVLSAVRRERRHLHYEPWNLDIYCGPILAGDMMAVDARNPTSWVERNILLLIQKCENEDGSKMFGFGMFDHFTRADWTQIQDVVEFVHGGEVKVQEAEQALDKSPT